MTTEYDSTEYEKQLADEWVANNKLFFDVCSKEAIAKAAFLRGRQSLKPSWNNAPEWAQWLAMDADGGWVFYRDKPRCDKEAEKFISNFFQLSFIDDFEFTLEERPK